MRERSASASSGASASAAGSAGSPSRSASRTSSWSASAAWSRACWARTSAVVTSSPRSRRRRWISASSVAQARSRAASALARGAAGDELGVERVGARGDRRGEPFEHLREARGAGRERLLGAQPAAQALDARGALGPLALGALGGPPLGPELAGDLRPAHGGGALLRRAAALLDPPGGAAALLLGDGQRVRDLAQGALGLLAHALGGRDGLLGGRAAVARGLLGRDGGVAGGDQLLAAVALGEHALLAAVGRLAQLAVAPVPDAAVARHRDAAEAGRQLLELLDEPGVPQQPHRDGEDVLVAADELRRGDARRAPAGGAGPPGRARDRR